MSLQSLRGLVLGSRHSLTIGSDGWLLTVIVLQSLFLAGHSERNPAEADRLASDLIELSTRHNFGQSLAGGEVLRGWAQRFR